MKFSFPSRYLDEGSLENMWEGQNQLLASGLFSHSIIHLLPVYHTKSIPADIGRRQGTPRTSFQFSTGLTKREKQPTHTHNLKSPSNLIKLTCMCLDWANQSAWREPTQPQEEHTTPPQENEKKLNWTQDLFYVRLTTAPPGHPSFGVLLKMMFDAVKYLQMQGHWDLCQETWETHSAYITW